MDFQTLLSMVNYGLVLIYGLFLSVMVAGGWQNRPQKRLVFLLCPIFLLGQGFCWLIWGTTAVRKLYPVIVHLPLVLILVLMLKKRVDVALVSVCTAYLFCQLPRWVNLAVTSVTDVSLIGEISYTIAIFLLYFLFRNYFVRIAHEIMTYSSQTVFLFGSLPFLYYLFDYATVIYSNALYTGIPALIEFFPTALIVFYVLFLAAYHTQTQKRIHAELLGNMLEVELKLSGEKLESLRQAETQAAIYQHNLRHHLLAIEGFLSIGNSEQAETYIKTLQSDIAAITPKCFCENELVNLLCTTFAKKAEQQNIRLTVDAQLPQDLFISDTELCSILSNGLENALHAVVALEEPLKWIELYCKIRANKLLIEIKNPYAGEIAMRDGLPVSGREGHGYGCRSIHTITEHYRGICAFEPDRSLFTLRVMLPFTQ